VFVAGYLIGDMKGSTHAIGRQAFQRSGDHPEGFGGVEQG